MNEEEQIDTTEVVSEQAEVEPQDNQEEQRLVPLAALQAERRKRQDTEARVRVYEEMMAKQSAQPAQQVEEEDPEELLTKGSYNQNTAMTKREILEQVYQDMNPEAVQNINKYLKTILDRKPWLAQTVDNAVNRLSRANEIVNDYMHLIEDKPRRNGAEDARKIVENSNKPRSPNQVGKSAQPSGTEYLKSIQGKKEFREYRAKVLRGEV